MKKHYVKSLKKHLTTGLLATALVFSLAVPVYAAVDAARDEVIARGTTPYLDYELKLTNGNIVYTKSGQNTSYEAYVKMSSQSSGINDAQVATYDANGDWQISSKYFISEGENVSISNAIKYPEQYIKAGFLKNGISGTYTIKGKFYYNGL